MKKAISWCVSNARAMNAIVASVLVLGLLAATSLRRETFPQFKLEIVLVTVPYPGASPSEIEDGICRKVEEAVHSLEGIKKVTSVAREGAGSIICELQSNADPQKALNEIKSEVDRIPSFPEFAEDPVIQQISFREPAIRVAVLGGSREEAMAEWDLRAVAEQIRDELLQLKNISDVKLVGRNYQIDVEIPEATLRKYNLTLAKVSETLKQRNLEIPAGNIKTENNDFLVRGKNKVLTGTEIGQLPILTTPEGTTLTINDLGTVRDGFIDRDSMSMVNGRPAINLTIQKSSREDLIQICQQVRDYVAQKKENMPEGYELVVWDDTSVAVQDRLNMLTENALQGLLIVFLSLSLFLEIRLAFWVSMGIPISILGGCAVMLFYDQTLNMISLFAFLMVLGIVVDDAIVIGENIFVHRQMGKNSVRAAIDATAEVAPSIAASVATTVVCFAPMFFVSGVMGKFIAVMPLAIVATLLVSLLEATFAFPCHLSHLRPEPRIPKLFRWMGVALGWRAWNGLRNAVDAGLQSFLDNRYVPFVRSCLRHPALVYSFTFLLLLSTWGFVVGGFTPFVFFPKVDADTLVTTIVYPSGTPGNITRQAVKQIEDAARQVNEEIKKETGEDAVTLYFRTVGQAENPNRPEPLDGSHVGQVLLELVPAERRTFTSDEFINRWRKYAGEFPGLEEPPTYGTTMVGPRDKAIEFKILSDDVPKLEKAVELAKAKLASKAGVDDIQDDSSPGTWEIQLKIKPEAQAMGITEQLLYSTLRDTFYGNEVMRLQRGRNEVKLMVRYPAADRKSLADLDEIRVRTPQGDEIPFRELADITEKRGYSEINRIDQVRSITVTAEVDDKVTNAAQIVQEMKDQFAPQLAQELPGVRIRWEGQQQQSEESLNSMKWGYAVALMVNFVLLTIEFKSYTQAIIIFICIPLGTAGAVIGHILWGLPITMFSIFGLVALAGIVVNDAIVLVDWINRLIAEGMPLSEAIPQGGRDRFRAILLTSVTTIGGLFPILFEQSLQAQIVIPMALTISFGLLSSTFWTLVLIPVMYQTWYRLAHPKMAGGHVVREGDEELFEEEMRESHDLVSRYEATHGGPLAATISKPVLKRRAAPKTLLARRVHRPER
jgi:multidrug efflux pump subunit AcrB